MEPSFLSWRWKEEADLGSEAGTVGKVVEEAAGGREWGNVIATYVTK